MPSPDTIRVGIVGAGGMVRTMHLPELRKIRGVEVVAISNRTRESSERASKEFGIPEIETDWRRLVQRDDVDAVFIGTWPDMHCPITIVALEAGKHVFCQARMARNLSEADAMLKKAAASDRVTMLCPTQHALKGDRTMRRLLHEGIVGQPRLVRVVSVSSSGADESRPLSWREDPAISGRNVLLLGAYIEVMHRWLGYARTISADMWNIVTERPASVGTRKIPAELPDSLTVIGEMESAARLNVVMSAAVHGTSEHVLEVRGDRGALRYDFKNDSILISRDGEPWHPIPIPPDEKGSWTAEADFIAAIRGGDPVHPDFHDGYKYMEFIEAVWLSHEKGRMISLPVT